MLRYLKRIIIGTFKDAHKLLAGGEKKFGTDDSIFNSILVTQNFHQLERVFVEYEKITGHGIDKAIEVMRWLFFTVMNWFFFCERLDVKWSSDGCKLHADFSAFISARADESVRKNIWNDLMVHVMPCKFRNLKCNGRQVENFMADTWIGDREDIGVVRSCKTICKGAQ